MGGRWGSFWRGARREASAWAPSRRSTSPPTSGPTPAPPRPSSSTWPRSVCSATGSSSARSSPRTLRPKHVVTKGATPVLTPAEARKVLDHIDTGTLAGLRDRALFLGHALQLRAGERAVLGMSRGDYFQQGSRGWLRLHEKGGRRHDVPAHHRAAEALDKYVEAAELEEPKATLFQSVEPAGRRLTGRALQRRVVLAMIKRRAVAGLPPSTCCHTFRATGIHGVPLEWGNPRARPADRGARVPEDDEALRPDRRHGHRR